ncbi:MAG: glucokinase [Sphingomonas sp. SCN 67-18]|uniref:glucokinase n=1 Tax=uncultured Sphingomonas sp. TaxID=158754 RepID=UPI0008697BD1|nr:glucokinase [Sphingomonas sp. SCN 67-18]ODU18703.1 MAG: glucokinase [Sphingomonas sp. SCN 67-18]
MDIVAVDIGGTNARFARATLAPGKPPALHQVHHYAVAAHPGLASAWRQFRADAGAIPTRAAIAVAAPMGGDVIRFINSPWTIQPARLTADLGLEQLTLLNDFGAVAHAVPWLEHDHLAPLAGPGGPIPQEGVTSVIGPGTGLGVAMLLRRDGQMHVIETEGAHRAFAPLDMAEDALLHQLRRQFSRVSDERIVSGPGLANIHRALAGRTETPDDKRLWAAAMDGSDPLAAAALDHFVRCFGAVAGDLALAHGANAVVIAGGLANRIADRLRGPAFVERFIAKGRYEARMRGIPVRLVTYEQPGLLGAAAAFQAEHGP